MITIDLREVTDAPRLASSDSAAAEPSHIHIPRPSRIRQPALAHHEDDAPLAAELELAFEDAA